MTVLTVGSNLQFATVSAAVAASHDGDTIYVQAGTYLNDSAIIKTDISIVGVGGMARFSGTIGNGKGYFVTNNDVTFDHVEFSGAKVGDHNGAGIRFQAGNLTITNSYFHDNENGLLAAANPDGTITIDHSEFNHNGRGDGLTHNIYVGMIDSFTITNSYSHDAVVGHEVKSRAAHTTVENNRIVDGNGTASYSVDLPNSGEAVVRNNIIQQGPHSENSIMMTFGVGISSGKPQWADSSLLIEGNTIVNEHPARSAKGLLNANPNVVAEITDNNIYGLAPDRIAVGNNVQSGNDTLTTKPPIDTSHPWADSPWDAIVWGGALNNVLFGSTVRDLFVGGSGADRFVIQTGGNSDTIVNFQAGNGGADIAQLQGLGFTDFDDVIAAIAQQGADAVLNLGGGKSLTFQDVSPSDFAANDFTFSGDVPPPPPDPTHPDPFTLPKSGASTNTVKGNGSNNTLTGTNSNDAMQGGAGNDTMRGGAGDDRYAVDSTNDVVVENAGEGIDTVGSSVSYTLPGNVENLNLIGKGDKAGNGNALNNIISGYVGNDTINGDAGNDIIGGKGGANVLTGGAGNDMFVFSQLDVADRVTDFLVGEDLIDLHKLLPTSYHGADPVADGLLAVTVHGGGLKILADPTHSGTMTDLVALEGIAPETLYIGLDVIW